ncbi:hypothetical protein HDF26_003179 [Pedobacter cryoconitis]|uniref:hypothetical protein n=1 Tax=Pedobacter cryoconitis TaxID=188932 RepID=UPI00160E3AEE|nr:hypothetical protein [Pedobacter cryoconitis]MBB6272722.1 hypothetical protein [Pedobacter cryoconitis]
MKYLFILFFLFCSEKTFSQSATYKLTNKQDGTSSNISIRRTDDQVEVNVIANWNNKARTYGQFTGKGTITDDKATIRTEKKSQPCKVILTFLKDSLNADFQDCENDQLPVNFSGIYTKIGDNVTGEYIVSADICYFYSKPDEKSRKKGFAYTPEVLNIEEFLEGNWGFATFMSEGKHLFGYVKLSDLKFKRTYLFD